MWLKAMVYCTVYGKGGREYDGSTVERGGGTGKHRKRKGRGRGRKRIRADFKLEI